MIARLILALLIAAFAVPAMAAAPCHDGMAMPHDAPAPMPEQERKAIPVHACMGCIPPASLTRHAVARVAAVGDVPRPIASVALAAGLAVRPATPPPRAGA